MSKSLIARIEKLEEPVARERASQRPWRVVWIDPETGEREDEDAEGTAPLEIGTAG